MSPAGNPNRKDAARPAASLWGTYVHGIFHNDGFRRSWLNAIRAAKGLRREAETFSVQALKEREFDRVAETVRQHVRMDEIYKLLGMK